MKTNKSLLITSACVMLLLSLVFVACQSESEHVISDPVSEANEDPQLMEINQMIADVLGYDSEQSLTEYVGNIDEWIADELEVEDYQYDSLAEMREGLINALAFYSYNEVADGWDQYLFATDGGEKLAAFTGHTLADDGMEYVVVYGKKKPKKKKKPRHTAPWAKGKGYAVQVRRCGVAHGHPKCPRVWVWEKDPQDECQTAEDCRKGNGAGTQSFDWGAFQAAF